MSADGLHTVRILEFPLDVGERASEAFDGLRREFTLVAMRTPDAGEVPVRLLQLIDALTDKFQGLSSETDRVRDAALARGDKVVPELVHHMPEAAAAACVAINDMCDEADAYCRHGEVLLSLASSPEAIVFRRWYLGEFTAQLNGEAPLPWPQADRDALLRDATLRGTTRD